MSCKVDRARFIDLAKGICIILVVLFHFDGRQINLLNLATLRMPLFFVLSGMFFRSYGGALTFVKKKVNNLLVPCVFWLLVSCVISIVAFYVKPIVLHEAAGGCHITVSFFNDFIRFNGAMWFLICLFITNVIFYFLHKYLSGKKLAAGVLAMTLIGSIIREYQLWLPLYIGGALAALPFFYAGYIASRVGFVTNEIGRPLRSVIAGVGLIGLSYAFCYCIGVPTISISMNIVHGNAIVTYAGCLLCVFGVLSVCKLIRWLPIVSYFGRYSLIVLCVHIPIIIHSYTPLSILLGEHYSASLHLIIVLALCVISIPLCKRFLPWFVAQKPLFK